MLLGGGNIDMNVISRIIERGLVKAGRLVRLEVTLPDRPGMLAGLTTQIAEQRANVVEIHHNRAFSKAGLGEVMVEVTLETTGRPHIQELHRRPEPPGLAGRRGVVAGTRPPGPFNATRGLGHTGAP